LQPTGDAWPCPARAVRCQVRSTNGRDSPPHPSQLPRKRWSAVVRCSAVICGRAEPPLALMSLMAWATDVRHVGRQPDAAQQWLARQRAHSGPRAATRPGEAGILSNRRAARGGEHNIRGVLTAHQVRLACPCDAGFNTRTSGGKPVSLSCNMDRVLESARG
jgi:hypothetical protein